MSLNVDKTKWFLFHPLSKRQFLPQTFPNLVIGDIHIKREHLITFLGVFIDENLSWKLHIQILSSKISKSIGIFYKSRDVLSRQCLKQLYFSFIHNYVNYANIAWASISKSKLERLHRCQKHAAPVIYHKDRYTHTSPLLNDMKALNVFKLKIFNILWLLGDNASIVFLSNVFLAVFLRFSSVVFADWAYLACNLFKCWKYLQYNWLDVVWLYINGEKKNKNLSTLQNLLQKNIRHCNWL